MGKDLSKLFFLSFNINFEIKLSMFMPLVKELDKLHDNNIVHRDIKVENMFYKNDEI
jgi:serine/threonine protein kinase